MTTPKRIGNARRYISQSRAELNKAYHEIFLDTTNPELLAHHENAYRALWQYTEALKTQDMIDRNEQRLRKRKGNA